jgi:hypothetical protein
LQTIEACVRAVPDEEFGLRTVLDDLSAIEHDDAVGKANGGYVEGACWAAKGKPDRYHETITIALLLLIAERSRDGEAWETFAASNPDLLQWPCPALLRFYSGEVLESARARESFVMPDGRI